MTINTVQKQCNTEIAEIFKSTTKYSKMKMIQRKVKTLQKHLKMKMNYSDNNACPRTHHTHTQ